MCKALAYHDLEDASKIDTPTKTPASSASGSQTWVRFISVEESPEIGVCGERFASPRTPQFPELLNSFETHPSNFNQDRMGIIC